MSNSKFDLLSIELLLLIKKEIEILTFKPFLCKKWPSFQYWPLYITDFRLFLCFLWRMFTWNKKLIYNCHFLLTARERTKRTRRSKRRYKEYRRSVLLFLIKQWNIVWVHSGKYKGYYISYKGFFVILKFHGLLR